jgi:hypothetical protein
MFVAFVISPPLGYWTKVDVVCPGERKFPNGTFSIMSKSNITARKIPSPAAINGSFDFLGGSITVNEENFFLAILAFASSDPDIRYI